MAIHGPDISGIQAHARARVMIHYTRIAEADGRPAMQRAMDAVKKSEAERVVAGGRSVDLENEATDRGVPVRALAEMVLSEAGKVWALERARVQLSLAIDAARTEGQVRAILDEQGITWKDSYNGVVV